MCSHYESVKNIHTLKSHFKAKPFPDEMKVDVWPGYLSLFIHSHYPGINGVGKSEVREAGLGSFGLIPHWAKDSKIAKHTYNARSETVAEKPSYRDAWRSSRRCIIPAEAIYEPDWRSGKAVPARISRIDNKPMGIAGLWAEWKSPSGETIPSFTMLTINADLHPFMRQFHKPDEEKRMVVILQDDQYSDWLNASTNDSKDFLKAYPAEALTCSSTPLKSLVSNQGSLF
jgi:putative SOS response-associated peptidase YedK